MANPAEPARGRVSLRRTHPLPCPPPAGVLRLLQGFILRTARDIARGLDHLHSALSLVHRDL